MDKFTGNRPHNGVILKSYPREYKAIREFKQFSDSLGKRNGNLVILLDQIIDPQNLGSIIRSAVFLGADHVLVNKKNKPPISAAVAKVSSGASECIQLGAVRTIKPFLSCN